MKMKELIKVYFANQYEDVKTKTNIRFNRKVDYKLEIERVIDSISTSKARGIDNILGEFYKNKEVREIIKDKFHSHSNQ